MQTASKYRFAQIVITSISMDIFGEGEKKHKKLNFFLASESMNNF